jgi:hypothetical protein
MKLLQLFVVFVAIVACGQKSSKAQDSSGLAALFEQKSAAYVEATQAMQANWPSDKDCDAALWAGLAKRAGQSLDIRAALQPDGRPMRKPFVDCITPTESKSTISNDMISGLMLGYLYDKDLDSLRSLYNYGIANKWIMGTPQDLISRVYLRPNGQSLMARAIHRLSGDDLPQRHIPMVYTPITNDDFEAHLQFVGLLMAKDLDDLSYTHELVLKQTCRYNKNDAFANIMCGHKGKAIELLMSEDYVYPPYVRGHENYKLVHWLLSAKLILE